MFFYIINVGAFPTSPLSANAPTAHPDTHPARTLAMHLDDEPNLDQREKHRTVKEKLVAFNPYASTVGKLTGNRSQTMGGAGSTGTAGNMRGMVQ